LFGRIVRARETAARREKSLEVGRVERNAVSFGPTWKKRNGPRELRQIQIGWFGDKNGS
jgi:hypothetical protein